MNTPSYRAGFNAYWDKKPRAVKYDGFFLYVEWEWLKGFDVAQKADYNRRMDAAMAKAGEHSKVIFDHDYTYRIGLTHNGAWIRTTK